MAMAMPSRLKSQLETVEKLFAEGNLKHAGMHAQTAESLFPSFPEAKRARVAIKVLAAAAANKDDHHGVLNAAATLGLGDKMTTGNMKQDPNELVRLRHKALCDLLDTARSGGNNQESAAAAAALKVVNQAFAALTELKRQTNYKAASAGPPPRRAYHYQQGQYHQSLPLQQQAVQEEQDGDDDGGDRGGGNGKRGRRGKR